MNDCCSPANGRSAHPKKHRCPASGQECSEVSARTISHHLKQSWSWTPSAARYFFCDDPECTVAYFGDDGSTIPTSQLRTRIGVKVRTDDRPLCYCFGINHADFRRDPSIKDFVIAQTKAKQCSCETSNPSGRCCLKDFPEVGK